MEKDATNPDHAEQELYFTGVVWSQTLFGDHYRRNRRDAFFGNLHPNGLLVGFGWTSSIGRHAITPSRHQHWKFQTSVSDLVEVMRMTIGLDASRLSATSPSLQQEIPARKGGRH